MTDKEHGMLFKTFVNWKVWSFDILKNLNKENIEEAKTNLKILENFHKENWEKYRYDHNLSGELIDLSMGISKIKTKIKKLEENQ